MSETKSVEEWEIQKDLLITGDVDLTEKMTWEELTQRWNILGEDATGVIHADRIKFLEANGYETTRENMTRNLSARPPEQQEDTAPSVIIGTPIHLEK